MSAPRVVLVGGGLATWCCAWALQRQVPGVHLTVLSAEPPERLGGQLASWNEGGYPVEHGLHALFGFYDHLLPIVDDVGASGHFTRSPRHVWIWERGRLNRFDLWRFFLDYRGFSARERAQCARALPALARLLTEAGARGDDHYDQLDDQDLRAFLGDLGFPASVLRSNFFRQLYDAPFNEPFPLSAAVGMKSLARIFSHPFHLFFNCPSRQALIEPLLEAVRTRGSLELRAGTRAAALAWSTDGTRVAGVVTTTGEHVAADHVVLAVGLDDLRGIDLGWLASDPWFTRTRPLQTVSSLSIQAWFRDDPVPPSVDGLVNGLPAPFGIMAPLARVRSTGPDRRLALPFEVSACGPEQGFEDVPDGALVDGFMRSLSQAGFRVPSRRDDVHVVLRRNRAPSHRYLLTLPGQLGLRPTGHTPVANLHLAGAWIRNTQLLPCADAAAESGLAAAARVSRALDEPATIVTGMPAAAPLVRPPPFVFPRSRARVFLASAAEALPALPAPLSPVVPGQVLLAILDHQDVHGEADPTGARYAYNEVMIALLARGPGSDIGVFPVALYLDDDTAVAAGREVYGFPKKAARVELGPRSLRVARLGLDESAPPGPVHLRPLLAVQWREARSLPGPSAGLLDRFASMPYFNLRAFPGGIGGPRLLRLDPEQVAVTRTSWLAGGRVVLGNSATDPVHRWLGSRALGPGVQIEFSLRMGPPLWMPRPTST